MKTKLKVGDKVIIISGTWKGTITKVTHVSENGRWVFVNYHMKSKYLRRNVELLVKEEASIEAPIASAFATVINAQARKLQQMSRSES